MAFHQRPTQNAASKKKRILSYEIRDKSERSHRSGINALEYDYNLDRLYSGSRDSTIKVWNVAQLDRNRFSINEPTNKLNLHDNSYSYQHLNFDRNTQNSSFNHEKEIFVDSLEHHTDWVNEITLCNNNRNLISVSNDAHLKVWDVNHGYCLSTLRFHKDYIRCLAHAEDKEIVASGGFDRMIYLWDIQTLTAVASSANDNSTPKCFDKTKSSVYSLAINQMGTLLASGSTERVIRLWDPRTRQKLLKLKGHSDNVRCLLMSRDGTQLLSGSSDGTIRHWSIGQQRCVSIIRVHDGGVWTLQTNESFSTLYSGGRDCKVFSTNLKNIHNHNLVCKETAPILKLLYVQRNYHKRNDGDSLWVATTNSSIHNWSIDIGISAASTNKSYTTELDFDKTTSSKAIGQNSAIVIRGNPAIIKYHILNDKRFILTKETDNSINLYDVLTAKKVEQIRLGGKPDKLDEDFEEEIKKRSVMLYVPNWFSVDLKCGLLCINLDESECFNAWVSNKDHDFVARNESDNQDSKYNLGWLLLQAIFDKLIIAHNQKTINAERDMKDSFDWNNRFNNSTNTNQVKLILIQQQKLNQFFTLPNHTPIILSEGQVPFLRLTLAQLDSEKDKLILQLPTWISNVIMNNIQPKYMKIPFYILPHENSGIKALRKERLSSTDVLQVRKVIDHVCEKMLTNNSEDLIYPDSVHSFNTVELYCNDQLLQHDWDLRTVKHFIWKSGGELVLHYMPVKESRGE